MTIMVIGGNGDATWTPNMEAAMGSSQDPNGT